jgi:hypothetical protein
MSPLELIKRGLLQGDWELVAEGYKNLTGEEIEPPKVEQQQTFGNERKFTNEELKYLPISFKGRPNKFAEDEELVKNACREKVVLKDGTEVDIDKALNPSGKRAYHVKRPKAKTVTKVCRQCQRSFKMSASINVSESGFSTGVLCDQCTVRGR